MNGTTVHNSPNDFPHKDCGSPVLSPKEQGFFCENQQKPQLFFQLEYCIIKKTNMGINFYVMAEYGNQKRNERKNVLDLTQLRGQINGIDEELLRLFTERMALTEQVAKFKMDNGLEVFQGGREQEIIRRVRKNAPDGLENSAEVLFTTIMDISKSVQYQKFYAEQAGIDFAPFARGGTPRVMCQGTAGAYSEQACRAVFENPQISFCPEFEDVFEAVSQGKAAFGVLPIQNSTAGSVHRTYELMKQYDFKIAAAVRVKISHCLAVNPNNSDKPIEKVYSHEQALLQCAQYLKSHGLQGVEYPNTALAGEYIASSDEPAGAICSLSCARRLGLSVLEENCADERENYTRFLVISKQTYSSAQANIVAVSLSLSHTASSLYRLLTKFSVAGLNLLRIESKPVASRDFSVVFYLDFEGAVSNPAVARLIAELDAELTYFRFLGNYYEIDDEEENQEVR